MPGNFMRANTSQNAGSPPHRFEFVGQKAVLANTAAEKKDRHALGGKSDRTKPKAAKWACGFRLTKSVEGRY